MISIHARVVISLLLLLLLLGGWLTQTRWSRPSQSSLSPLAQPAKLSTATPSSLSSEQPKESVDELVGQSPNISQRPPPAPTAAPAPPAGGGLLPPTPAPPPAAAVTTPTTVAHSPPVYVALSATFGEQYAFYLPLTVLVWKELGIGSVVFLVGNRWGNPVGKFIVDTIKEFGAIVSFMPVPAHIPLTIVAQHARFYAPWLPGVAPEAVLITSDADIWPFRASLYALDTAQFDVRVVDCFAFSFFRIIVEPENGRLIRRFKTVHPSRENVSGYVIYPQFPITNIVMSARHWRKVLNVTFADSALSAETVWEALTSFLGYAPSVLQASRRGPLWFSDQFFISAKIMSLNYARQLRVQLIPRRTRIDRLGPKGIWCPPEKGMDCAVVRRVNDSHNPRKPHLKGQQRCLMGILRCILPPPAMR
eukprot:EG_transcript_12654